MRDSTIFADLRQPRRIWAIGAIHGEVARLMALHDEIGRRFAPGDRLVYLGNMVGHGPGSVEVMEELLGFRRALIAMPGMLADDVVFLRGAQEEMLQKLMQLQLAPNPAEVLDWMLRQGLGATLAAYGVDAEDGMRSARAGAVVLTRWTNGMRAALRARPGHENVLSALRRAAFASEPDPAAPAGAGHGGIPGGVPAGGLGGGLDGGSASEGAGEDGAVTGRHPTGVLLVSAGLDPSRPLGAQGDAFWWGAQGFMRLDAPYETFRRVVRGHDPAHGGVRADAASATIDAGAGFGGRLACACIAPDGDFIDLFEA
jgi:hypothetical protein